MSKYTSCTYYSSINSVQEDLSKKLRSNSLITYKSSLNNITNDEKNNWMSIIKTFNDAKNNETAVLIEDLNFKKKLESFSSLKLNIFVFFNIFSRF